MSRLDETSNAGSVRQNGNLSSSGSSWPLALTWIGGAWAALGFYGLVFPLSPIHVVGISLLMVTIGLVGLTVSRAQDKSRARLVGVQQARRKSRLLPASRTAPIDLATPDVRENVVSSIPAIALPDEHHLESLRGEIASLSEQAKALSGTLETAKLNAPVLTTTQQDSKLELSNQLHALEQMARRLEMVALNAAIEAARAKEHGSGFAIVAKEVRFIAGKLRTQVDVALKTLKVDSTKVNSEELLAKTLGTVVDGVGTLRQKLEAITRMVSIGVKPKAEAQAVATVAPVLVRRIEKPSVAKPAKVEVARSSSKDGMKRALTGEVSPRGKARRPSVAKTRSMQTGFVSLQSLPPRTAPVVRVEKPKSAGGDEQQQKESPAVQLPATTPDKSPISGGHDAEDAHFERYSR